jgi:hypothetical protein
MLTSRMCTYILARLLAYILGTAVCAMTEKMCRCRFEIPESYKSNIQKDRCGTSLEDLAPVMGADTARQNVPI